MNGCSIDEGVSAVRDHCVHELIDIKGCWMNRWEIIMYMD